MAEDRLIIAGEVLLFEIEPDDYDLNVISVYSDDRRAKPEASSLQLKKKIEQLEKKLKSATEREKQLSETIKSLKSNPGHTVSQPSTGQDASPFSYVDVEELILTENGKPGEPYSA